MTAIPEPSESSKSSLPGVDHLLTITEYAELGEPESGYTELLEGRLLMSPSPGPGHNIALFELYLQVKPQLPRQLIAVPDIDVDLELAPLGAPATARRPDLVVVERAAVRRVDREGGLLKASDVRLVVEIVSPGSTRTDNVDKRGEYADAGIPHYWIVDITEPASLVACHLAGEFGYQDGGAVTGEFVTHDPFAVRVNLDALL